MLNNVNGRIMPKGWILEHLRRDKEGIAGKLDKLCPDADSSIFKDKKVQHKIDGYWSSWWPGETEGNWMIAYVDLACALGDGDMIKKASSLVYDCISCQGEDGYMGIYLPGYRYLADSRCGELWTQSRLMLAALSLYQYNNDKAILNALEKMADLTVRQFGPLSGGRSYYEVSCEDGSKTHGLMIVEPLLTLYSLLCKNEYLEFAEWLYLDYSGHDMVYPTFDLAINNAINPETPFIGHGPHTCEQLRIPLLLYAHTGNELYKAVYISAYAKLRKNTPLSGSCKSDELIGVFKSYIPEDQRIGANLGGCVPIPSAGYEYCSTTELVYSYMAGMKILENPIYADNEEWMVHNAAMAARRHDGKAIQYLSADNCWDASHAKGTRWDFSPTHADAAVCCAPNSCKLMCAHIDNMWLQDGNRLYAALYGPCVLETIVDGQTVIIEQDTAYPFETEIRFTIKLKKPQKLMLEFRIPGWAKSHQLSLNGKKMEYPLKEREYKDGDELMLVFEAETTRLRAADGTYALAYGPLLYALSIPHIEDNYFAYDLPGFYDTDYMPAPKAKWEYTMLGATIETEKTDICDAYPWDTPPLKLKTVMLSGHYAVPEEVSLVPIGATILKRATFPMSDYKL